MSAILPMSLIKAGLLHFHGRIRADFVSLVPACERKGGGGEDAEGLHLVKFLNLLMFAMK